MDERLEKALKLSNYMVTFNNQRKIIKEKYFEDLIHFEDGCQFTVSKDLIVFVKLLIDSGNNRDIILTDDHDNPANISDLDVFYENILNCYFTATNRYYTEYNNLKKKRSIESLVNLDDKQ